MLPLLALFGICMALNTVPSLVATTAVVTLFAFRDDVGAVEAVVVGVAGAVIGRVLFALAIRHGAERFIRGRLRRTSTSCATTSARSAMRPGSWRCSR